MIQLEDMDMDKKTILVVDDEESYRNLFSNKLRNEGFLVLEAKDGKEGLQIALLKNPDLILLDLAMPGMDGMSMLSALRKDDWGKNARVIILTNVSDNAKIAEAIKNETFTYLVKSDMSMEELVSKVKKNLNK